MKWLIVIGIVVVVGVGLVVAIGFLLPKQHVATRSVRLRRSPEDVWKVIVGPPDWRSGVKSFEVLPARGGRRTWKEVDRHGDSITYEEMDAQPARRLVTRIADPTLPYGGSWTHEIASEADGCSLTITENGEIYNPVFRFVSRFILGYTASLDAYLAALRTKLGER
jgi:hypothetical protein